MGMRPGAGTAAFLGLALITVVLLSGCSLVLRALVGENDAPAEARFVPHEIAAFRMVNAFREERGLQPIGYSEHVAEIARQHSHRMATGSRTFGHDGFRARSEALRLQFPIRSIAENVAHDSKINPAASVVEGWIGSPAHRSNIEGNFSATGVGVARSSGGRFYFTQIFVAAR
jgi:uncharacterized protein YkwD